MHRWQCPIHSGTIKSFVASSMNKIVMLKTDFLKLRFRNKNDLCISSEGKQIELNYFKPRETTISFTLLIRKSTAVVNRALTS